MWVIIIARFQIEQIKWRNIFTMSEKLEKLHQERWTGQIHIPWRTNWQKISTIWIWICVLVISYHLFFDKWCWADSNTCCMLSSVIMLVASDAGNESYRRVAFKTLHKNSISRLIYHSCTHLNTLLHCLRCSDSNLLTNNLLSSN